MTRNPWVRRACFCLVALLASGSGTASGDARARNEVLLSVSVGAAQGKVFCGVYERGGWLKRPVKGSAAGFRGNVATCRFADLKPGTYAAGAFQDANSNGKFDRSWTGLPKEPWCVSRGPRGTLGPPSFDAAMFSVGEGTVRLTCSAR
ncbi:MAG TPA: DUF2141 domain-containing protein [Polyangiaceae bacterium]